jgi:hypothetical protein
LKTEFGDIFSFLAMNLLSIFVWPPSVARDLIYGLAPDLAKSAHKGFVVFPDCGHI